MQQNFSYTLLITWILFTVSSKTNNVPTSFRLQNLSVLENVKPYDSKIVQMIFQFKNILGKSMKG